VIPLLFEAKMTDLVTEIWVVTCPLKIQIQRLIQRNSLTETQATSRIQSQLPLTEKVRMADIVIDNSRSLEDL
jgi:dephospho-CoA kinase